MNIDKKTKIENIKQYVKGILNQEELLPLYERYKQDINDLQPEDLFDVFSALIKEGIQEADILIHLDKVIHAVYNTLYKRNYELRSALFLESLDQENQALIRRLKDVTTLLVNKDINNKTELNAILLDLEHFLIHYQKKENILFPMMEKKDEKFDGLSIMWALHDEIRRMLKSLQEMIGSNAAKQEVILALGNLFFSMRSLIIKEEMLLFPLANELLSEEEETDMLMQCQDYGFALLAAEELKKFTAMQSVEKPSIMNDLFYQSNTGNLSFEQISLLFSALPVDLSFVDENNVLRYFSKPKDRIFPRSEAAIGRNVRNCHPPKSVDRVLEIIDAFREQRKSHAMFWLDIKDKKILIQYFALRNEKDEYKGVLEVSMDITEIQKLEGERKLLSWDE